MSYIDISTRLHQLFDCFVARKMTNEPNEQINNPELQLQFGILKAIMASRQGHLRALHANNTLILWNSKAKSKGMEAMASRALV